jgi:hypothetical protein
VKIMQSGGKELLVNYVEHYPPDTTAAVFWLKNRQPDKWRDKTISEVSGPNGNPIEIADVTARELVERRIAGLAARGEGKPTEH